MGSGDAASGDQARADSVRAFCEAIAELRSLGEGFILSSQTPSALAQAAIANTGVRIVHRLESGDDRKVMMDDMGADERIRDIAARLRQGEAIVRWPERDEVEVVRVQAPEDIDSGRFVSDEAIAVRMQPHRAELAKLLPYQLCSLEVCTSGCTSRVRRTGMDVAESVESVARVAWLQPDKVEGIKAIMDRLAAETDRSEQSIYCAAVHLSIRGTAFPVKHGIDNRPVLIREVRDSVRRNGQ